MSGNSWLASGAVIAGLAVVFGAFAAHGMDTFVVKKYAELESKTIAGQEFVASWKYLQDFKTAAEYQMYHALGLLVVGLMARTRPTKSLQVAGWCLLLGIVLFSGSLYVLVFTGQFWLGAITPIGGTLFIVGWAALAVAARASETSTATPA